MDILKSALGILAFAFITAILYLWGIRKSLNHIDKVTNMLYNEGENRVIKYLDKNKKADIKEIEELVKGIKSGVFYSMRKATVNNPEAFARALTWAIPRTIF